MGVFGALSGGFRHRSPFVFVRAVHTTGALTRCHCLFFRTASQLIEWLTPSRRRSSYPGGIDVIHVGFRRLLVEMFSRRPGLGRLRPARP